MTLLSHAQSPQEIQHAFTAPPAAKPQPKTFPHAIARASLSGSQLLNQTHPSGAGEDPLAAALEKYALASEKVGEARLAQDAQIQSRFLAGWSTTLNTNLMFATRARRGVESARLNLDAQKARAKAGGSTASDEMMTEDERAKIEQKEDEFVGQTEEAVGVMKNVRPSCVKLPFSYQEGCTSLSFALPDHHRFLTPPSPSATLPTSSPLSSSTIRKRVRSSASLPPSSTVCRWSRKPATARAVRAPRRATTQGSIDLGGRGRVPDRRFHDFRYSLCLSIRSPAFLLAVVVTFKADVVPRAGILHAVLDAPFKSHVIRFGLAA